MCSEIAFIRLREKFLLRNHLIWLAGYKRYHYLVIKEIISRYCVYLVIKEILIWLI